MRHHRLARATQRALCPVGPSQPSPAASADFADRIAADLALALIRSQGRALGKDPVRSCRCPQCDGWHLTSVRW